MSQEKSTKIFVLDTNVILHDSNSIQSFHEHDIAIPITVLEEVDQFKKGHNVSIFKLESSCVSWMDSRAIS